MKPFNLLPQPVDFNQKQFPSAASLLQKNKVLRKANLICANLATLFLCLLMLSCSKKNVHADKETIIEYKVFDNASINDMSFVNKNMGFISGSYDMNRGSALIAKTTDGGITWQQISVYINNSPTTIIRSIYAKNKDTIYATYNAKNSTYGVCFSKDGGMTWSALGSPKPFVAYTGLFFQNAQTGFVCGGVLWKTNDGGNSWQEVYKTNSFLHVGQLFFTSNLIGYAYGGFCDDGGCSGIIVKTTDGGDTWTMLPLKELATSLNFISDDIGYAFTFDNNIYETTDGGMNWQLLNNTGGGAFFSSIVDGDPKYFATNEWIYRSDDNFATFRKIYTTSKPGALSVKAVHPAPNIVYFAPAGRSIIKLIIHR